MSCCCPELWSLGRGDKGQRERCPSPEAAPMGTRQPSQQPAARGSMEGPTSVAGLRPCPAAGRRGPMSTWSRLQWRTSAVVNAAAAFLQSVLLLMERWFCRLLKVFISGRQYRAFYSGCNTGE